MNRKYFYNTTSKVLPWGLFVLLMVRWTNCNRFRFIALYRPIHILLNIAKLNHFYYLPFDFFLNFAFIISCKLININFAPLFHNFFFTSHTVHVFISAISFSQSSTFITIQHQVIKSEMKQKWNNETWYIYVMLLETIVRKLAKNKHSLHYRLQLV